jgi:hypothetical protein
MIYTLMVFLFMAFGTPALASPQKISVDFESIYVPGGFDSNDHVQIVGEGRFESTCYKPAETDASIDTSKHEIHLSPVAYKYPGLCLQVILPFERVIDIGILSAGTYSIFSNGKKLGEIQIKKATTQSADDFLYAPVSQAFFRQKGLLSEVLLAGEFPNDCFKIDDVKVTFEPKVIVLQPLAKLEHPSACREGRFPFYHVVPIYLAPVGRYLLHVRSMNGKAINSLIEVK